MQSQQPTSVGFFFVSILFQPFHDSSKGMMMLMHKLTDVNTKVFCSNCSAMFHLLEQTQVVDFKGENGTFSMFVPMFHNIYKGSRMAKYFTMLSDWGRLARTSLVQTHIQGGTMEQPANEASNTMISLNFSPFRSTGTTPEHTEQCLKIKQKQGTT